jgi:hypothetical protein
VVAGDQEAKKGRERERLFGWQGKLGTFLGAPFSLAARERAERRAVDEAHKDLKARSPGEKETRAMLAGGGALGAAAARYALGKDYLKTPADFVTARGLSTGADAEEIQKAYESRHPARAVLGEELRAAMLAPGTPGRARVTTAQRERLQEAVRRTKPENFAKMDADDLKVVIDILEEVGIPMTQAQFKELVSSANTPAQRVAVDYIVNNLRQRIHIPPGQVGALKPAERALEHWARQWANI